MYKNHSTKIETNQPKLHFGKPPKLVIQIILKPRERGIRKQSEMPFGLRRIVCSECCLPLYLYGKDFIASYLDEQAELLPSLCDLLLAEMEAEVAS